MIFFSSAYTGDYFKRGNFLISKKTIKRRLMCKNELNSIIDYNYNL